MNQIAKIAYKLQKLMQIGVNGLTYLIQCGPLRLYQCIDYVYGVQGGLVSLKRDLVLVQRKMDR